MKFYCFQKRQQETGESAMFWFTSKAEAEKKLREEVKNNPYDEDMRDVEYMLSDNVDCFDIPTDKKGLLRFLLVHVNIDNNQHYPMKLNND
tara:strand:- start:31 stop:303 length:273 start_codon:yes stop_codon:yes gene_type:complete